MLGDILGGRYVLSGFLGAGGMAEVYLAHDRILDRDLALKVLREDYAKDSRFVGRFRKEAQSAAALNHPHVVQVYDQGRTEDGRYYIAMEHVPGGNLGDRILRRGPLACAEAARLACQVAEALHAAHALGIVHRDVKPKNVLLDDAGDTKVADFGIALAASTSSTSTSSTSGMKLVFGTASYMSPEQAMAERVGPQSDLYSLGVVLYEMLTGRVPFEAEGALATAMKHVTEQPLPPRKLNPSVPEAMDALVMRLLAKNPEDRYESAAELAEDLRRMREGLPLAFAGVAGFPGNLQAAASTDGGALPGSPRSKPRWRRSMGTGLVTLAALLALLGALGWDLSRKPERVKAVGAVTTSEGSREGSTLEAPEGSESTQEDGVGEKGTGSHMPSAVHAGGAYVPASSSVSTSASASASASAPPTSASHASVPASAPAAPAPPVSEPTASEHGASEHDASEPRTSKPQASEPSATVPFSSAPAPGSSSSSSGQGAGTKDPGAGRSAAQEQYR